MNSIDSLIDDLQTGKRNPAPVVAKPKKKSDRVFMNPADKAKLTMGGMITGRISLAQQDLLFKLGIDRKDSVGWTKYKASKEIEKRLAKKNQASSKA